MNTYWLFFSSIKNHVSDEKKVFIATTWGGIWNSKFSLKSTEWCSVCLLKNKLFVNTIQLPILNLMFINRNRSNSNFFAAAILKGRNEANLIWVRFSHEWKTAVSRSGEIHSLKKRLKRVCVRPAFFLPRGRFQHFEWLWRLVFCRGRGRGSL